MLDDVKIMQFADGTLDPSEREIVQKEIENNPKYKKLLKDYTYTGEILSNISREIKSKPLPKYLENKVIEFNKNSIKTLSKNKLTFNFFNILNIKYSAIAAVSC
jgi:ethanolamine utilization cobalamin adenosyltransferase